MSEAPDSLTYSTLPAEIKRLGRRALGSGVLQSLFTYRYTYHMMVKVMDDSVVAFALYHYETEKRAKRMVIVGVLDCVCVDPEYQRQGIGTLMTFATLRKMSATGASMVDAIVKLPATDNGPRNRKPYSVKLDDFMRALGFELQGYHDNHYVKSSLKYRYSCIICDSLPDKCRAAHYAIAEDEPDTVGDDE